MQVNTSIPISSQNFGSARFHKIPEDMQNLLKSDYVFNKIAQQQDIFVSARPKLKWSDPFGLRTPQASEKCWLSYKINDSEFSQSRPVLTDNNFIAPLKEHIQTLLEKLSIERILGGIDV